MSADRLRLDSEIFASRSYGAHLAPEWDPVRDHQQEYLALGPGDRRDRRV